MYIIIIIIVWYSYLGFSPSTSHRSAAGIFGPKKDDPTQLVATFQVTGLGGIVSLLYGILLHGGAPSRDSTMTPPEIPEHTVSVVNAGIKMLSSIATLDLNVLQVWYHSSSSGGGGGCFTKILSWTYL